MSKVANLDFEKEIEDYQSQGEVIARAMEAKVGGANLPIDGGGTGSNNRN